MWWPIFKKGSKREPGNYRPETSNLYSCKIFEGFSEDVILDYLNENNLVELHISMVYKKSLPVKAISNQVFYDEYRYLLVHGVSLSCTPSVSVIILHPKCQCHYPAPRESVSLSCTPSVSVIILHPECQCHYPAPRVSVSLSCTPSVSVIILYPSVSVIILHPKCQCYYPAHRESVSLSCTPSVSVIIPYPELSRCGGMIAWCDKGTMLTSDESSVVAAALVFEAARLQEERRPKRKRRMWTRSWLQKRSTLSHMGLIRELRDNNPQDFRNYLRMSEESFKIILSAVTPLIQRCDTPMRAAVPVEERLAVTLRFLATGRSLQDLQFSAAVSRPFLSVVIPETCEAIVQSLRHYMEFPKTADDWKRIASDFDELWQFPNCGGYFSVILMALVNANYEFVDVDVGMNGRVSDGGVFEHTSFGESLRNNELLLPLNEDTKANLNFVFIADEAFPLHPHLLKPFAQRTLTPERRIFNYRLSRARRVVENAFGIMANRFRVFHTAINLKLPSIDIVVLACCVLHNFLRRHDTNSYSPPSFIDAVDARTGDIVPGEWRTQPENFTALQALGSGRQADDARDCREKYCQYFNGSGAVPWQDRAV
ncbi:unnamed protein product [Ranitomeya imitator]|uniref:DDE Tnp4 domain-containing protein n=1 Tax=Ranitomeya imitator TaxID=111125 RepID=A0ABN9LD22_9NEOB|nr:unnamed protein product [Ranitomeya imitator]